MCLDKWTRLFTRFKRRNQPESQKSKENPGIRFQNPSSQCDEVLSQSREEEEFDENQLSANPLRFNHYMEQQQLMMKHFLELESEVSSNVFE